MPIRIRNVVITPNETTVGQLVSITVTAEDISWGNLQTDFTTWGEVRRSFTDWNHVKNYIYSIPNPTPDADCLYDSNGNALFDVDAVQISIRNGGATLKYTGDEVDQFIREVVDG